MKRCKLQMTILLLWFLLGHVVTTVYTKIVKRTLLKEGTHMRRLYTICSELHRNLGWKFLL